MFELTMLEPNDDVSIEANNTREEEDVSYSDGDQASEDIPQSLLSYFEISRSRAAVCERLLLNEVEDFPEFHHTEGEAMKKHQIENESEKNLNDEIFLNAQHAAAFTNNSRAPNAEGDGALDESVKTNYIPAFVKFEKDQQEKQRKQREIDFQEDLLQILAAEKHNEMEIELNKRRDQEKLKQELQLQQELINNIQKQVEHKTRIIEVGQRRQKDEDERRMVEKEERKRRKEEEQRRRQQERRIMVEEEERRVMIERKLKEDKKRKEEEKRKCEEENTLREEIVKKEWKRKKEEELMEQERKRLVEEIKRDNVESEKIEEEMKSLIEQEGNKKYDHRFSVNCRQIKHQNEHEIQSEKTEVKQQKDEKGKITKEEEERIMKDKCIMKVTGKMMSVKEITQRDLMAEMKSSEEEKQKMKDEDEKGSEEGIRYVDKLEITKNFGKMEQIEEKIMAELIRKEKAVEVEIKLVGGKDQTKKNISNGMKHLEATEPEQTEGMEDRGGERGGKVEEHEKMQEVNSQENHVTELKDEPISGKILNNEEQERKIESREGLKVTTLDSLNLMSSSNKTMAFPNIPHPLLKPNQEALISEDEGHPGSTECLPDHTEQKRLLWMKECIPWSKMSLQNKRKQKSSAWSGMERRRGVKANGLPPLSQSTLLQCTGCTSLEQVTTLTLEDLGGCSLSTLLQCPHLHSLTLRRCGLRALDGCSKLQKLCYIDVQENEISYVDCENMRSLRILRLSRNKLTSIHGLRGVENLDFLELSHNSISRIAGLEFTRRLQRLLLDHNQLISTKGLRDSYTLLHLDCSHNHLTAVEGLENSALLQSLDLRGNSITELPILNNQVLLRELYLDDNNISSLQSLTACWLPLMQHLSVGQNRITELPSMWDFLSLQNLDLQFNCLSDLKDVCRNLEGCKFLHAVHFTGNPLQQESDWRSALQAALSGLKAIDGQQTESFLPPPAGQQVNSSPDSFQAFCLAQLKQTHDLEKCHGETLSNASPTCEAIKDLCLHFNLTLKLAEDQRVAHEHRNKAVSKCKDADLTTKEITNSRIAENLICHTEEPTMSSSKLPAIDNNIGFNSKMTIAQRKCGFNYSLKEDPKVHISAENGRTTSFPQQRTSVDLKTTASSAAAVIQHWWRKYKQKCRNVNALVIVKKEGEREECERKPQSEPNRHAVNQDSAACVIQAFWRGFALRRRLTSALTAVTFPNAGEDDTLEEVDLDKFVFDEVSLEKQWTLPHFEDFPYDSTELEQPSKLARPWLDPFQCNSSQPLLMQPAKQAWVAPKDSAAPDRIKSSVPRSLSARSENIVEEWGFNDSHTALLMLKRARNMKSKKQPQRKHQGQTVMQASLKTCNYLRGASETLHRPAPRNRSFVKVGEAKLGLQEADRTEQMKQEPVQRWLHIQAAQSDRLSETEHFLPDIHSPILNGGQVQLAADQSYAARQHRSSGFCSINALSAQLGQVNNFPRGIDASTVKRTIHRKKKTFL